MSSAAYNRLHSLFNSTTGAGSATGTAVSNTTTKIIKEKIKRPKKTPTEAAATTTATSRPKNKKTQMAFEPLPMSQLTDSLKNLKMFIDTFKRSSNVGSFRYNYKIYNDVVSHLAKSRQHAYIEEILEHQKRYKTEMTHESFVARLISLYGKARMFDHARKVFDEMPELNCPRTVLSANALLNACINSKKVDKMPELFRELKEVVGIEPDEVSYNVMIKALCEMEDCDFALKMIDEMEMNGCECSLYTYNTIIVALYAKGLVSDGDKLWEVMRGKNIEPDVWTYNAKVRGLIVDKRIDEAVQLINEMKGNGVTPDVYTYNGLIHGFVKEDDLVGVKKWYAEMVENKIVPDLVTFRMIINFASKRADYRYAYELSRTSLLRELNVSRSSLQGVVDGLVKESAIDEAKELVELVNKQSNLLYYKLKLSVNKYLRA